MAKPNVPIPTARQLAELACDHPLHTGAGFIAAGVILKTSFFVKVISYACLLLGALFIWNAYQASRTKDITT